MKHLIFLPFILLLFTCNQADYSNIWEQAPEGNHISIKQKKKKWRNVSVIAKSSRIDNYFSLNIGRIERYHESHNLSFHSVPKEIGKHPVCLAIQIQDETPDEMTHIRASYSSVIPEDAWIARYLCVDDPENYFTITDYDPQTQVISGNFKVKLKATFRANPEETDEFIWVESENFTALIED